MVDMQRTRQSMLKLAGTVLAGAIASQAFAADFPNKPIQLVIPSAAHISNIEQAQIFTIAVRDFLTRMTAGK